MRETKPDKFIIGLRIARYENGKLIQKTGNVEMEPIPIGNIGQIRTIIRQAVDEGFLREGDSVVAVADETLGIGFGGLILFFNIDEKFMKLTTLELRRELNKSVFDSVLEVSREIAKEGREGRKIGTAFIIGDYQKVLENSRQLILNPLEGHPIERRNITDASFKETIKELAQLDGVFVIDKEGFVHTAGSYLTVKPGNLKLQGLGGRHQACAALTKKTSAIAVCVSESGGTIRVFNNGEIIIEEKP
jgi:DNA integrity scanning protein DisA with diadenylate cyclase activity